MNYILLRMMPLVLITMCLTGCWDKKELNDLAVVMGVGLDKGENGEIQVTAQVIRPPTKQGGSAGGSSLPTWSLSENGSTVMDAISHLNEISPRRLYWPHMQIIIFGDAIARDGIAPFLNWFERNLESRTGTLLAVTQGKAADLLNTKIELGNVPAKTMADLIQTSDVRQLPTRKTTLREFMSFLSTPGIDTSMDVINLEYVRGKPETYSVSNMAVFDGDKLKGYVARPERNAVEIVNNKFNHAIVKMPCPGRKSQYLTIQVTDFRNRRAIKLNNDEVTMQMNIFIEGNLNDQTCEMNLLQPDLMQRVEDEIKQTITGYVEKTFRLGADMNADIFGIGRELRRYYPGAWNRMQEQWDSLLPEVKFDMKVDANIRRNGLVIDPTENKMKAK